MARKVRGSGIVIGLDAGEVGVERRSDRDAFMTGLDSISNILPELFWVENCDPATYSRYWRSWSVRWVAQGVGEPRPLGGATF